MKKLSSLIVILCFVALKVAAQQAPQPDSGSLGQQLFMDARTLKDRVILRWAPANYPLWMEGNKNGYTLERIELNRSPYLDTTLALAGDTSYLKITPQPIKAWSLDDWKLKVKDTSDYYPGVAMEILYGAPTPPTTNQGEMGAIKAAYDDQKRRHGYALLSADLSATAAEGLGLRYEDKDVKPGHYYAYRVYVNNPSPAVYSDTAYMEVSMNILYEPEQVKHAFTEEFNKQVAIFWTRHNDQFFSAYDVERSQDQVNWKPLNKRPFVTSDDVANGPNMFVDTTVELNQKYYYRLRGYTAYGDKGAYSEVLVGNGKDLLGPSPAYNVQAEDLGDGGVLITWESSNKEADFVGFYVGRNEQAAGEFEKISDLLPTEARTFVDFTPNPLESNFYQIISVDSYGNETKSYVDLGYIVDSIPPTAPTGLSGAIDTTGRVDIQWDRGPEADIIGYRVYWSNNIDAEYSQLTGDLVPGLNFVDSVIVKTLSEEVYYKVVAVDHRYNHSPYSAPLTLKKPDLVPPAAAVIKDYTVDESGVYFDWVNSVSEDVLKQEIEKQNTQGEWEVIATFTDNQTHRFADSGLAVNTGFAYRIAVVDDAENKSYSFPLMVTTFDRGVRKGVTDLSLTVNADSAAELSWSSPQNEVSAVLIYVQTAETFKTLSRVSSTTTSYKDPAYIVGNRYGVKLLYTDGAESPIVFTEE